MTKKVKIFVFVKEIEVFQLTKVVSCKNKRNCITRDNHELINVEDTNLKQLYTVKKYYPLPSSLYTLRALKYTMSYRLLYSEMRKF